MANWYYMNEAQKRLETLERRRRELVDAMLSIRSMCGGKISEQFLQVHHKGKKQPVERGPYYVLSCWKEGRNQSRRIRSEALEEIRADLANHERFVALCREFEELTERLGALEREEAAEMEAVKKGLNSRSRRSVKYNA